MKTRKAVSSISYNTSSFLQIVLDEWVDKRKISFYMFIFHLREEDERKNHIHLFVQPNTLIDTMQLQADLREEDPEGRSPLGCIDFRPSDPDEWILYCRHYPPYLASKGQSRKYEYDEEMFCVSDLDTFAYYWDHALCESSWAKNYILMKDITSVRDPIQLINTGRIPLSQAGSLVAYERLKSNVFRAGRVSNH